MTCLHHVDFNAASMNESACLVALLDPQLCATLGPRLK